VFGLNAGAVIALQAALELAEIHKLALSFDRVSHTSSGICMRLEALDGP
jgi:hypothetical protein